MVIRASAGREINALITALSSDDSVARDTAIARLTVIGTRAVSRLTFLATDAIAAPDARIAALKTLEAIADARAFEPAEQAAADDNPLVAAAAINLMRSFVNSGLGMSAVDRLTGIALDRARPDPTRLAALGALAELDRTTLEPLLNALGDDPSAQIAAAAKHSGHDRDHDHARILAEVGEGKMPDDPAILRKALADGGNRAALPALLRVVEQVRDHESREKAIRREEWTTARGAAHATLARRGSRIALYDLRETLQEAAGPLPIDYLAALTAIGDASCLEAIAAAFAKALKSGAAGEWWREHLADAFQAIVTREGVTRRGAQAKAIEKRWPGALSQLWP